MKAEAILNLYSKVKTVENDSDGNIRAFDIDGNEISIDMNAVNTKATELQTEQDNTIQAKIDLKASAKAKLIAGEPLTEEEAGTIVL
ncbi:MAG: hypothetical protein CBB68_00095 [Rhodospirillaceae bacterium TMED8]|jgi:hypothetical protein|nr:MAG: hypothetical protein CBB68_00095 [Rhodospirillaceae bacterium TMED8]